MVLAIILIGGIVLLTPGFLTDLLGFAPTRPAWGPDGRWLVFTAPIDGSNELWRLSVADRRVEPVTRGRHYLSRADTAPLADGGLRVAAMRVDAVSPPDVVVVDVPAGGIGDRGIRARRVTDLTGEAWRDVAIVAPTTRWHEVDGRRIQGWFYRAPDRDGRPAPLVVEIHGGPATLYGWSLMWEWQCLVAAGITVYACNPRGSQGYGQAFNAANYRDWGPGPARDVLAGVEALRQIRSPWDLGLRRAQAFESEHYSAAYRRFPAHGSKLTSPKQTQPTFWSANGAVSRAFKSWAQLERRAVALDRFQFLAVSLERLNLANQ